MEKLLRQLSVLGIFALQILVMNTSAAATQSDVSLLLEAKKRNTVEAYQAYQRQCTQCKHYQQTVSAITSLTTKADATLFQSLVKRPSVDALNAYLGSCTSCERSTKATVDITALGGEPIFAARKAFDGPVVLEDEEATFKQAKSKNSLQSFIAYVRGCTDCAHYAEAVAGINAIQEKADRQAAELAFEDKSAAAFGRYLGSCKVCAASGNIVALAKSQGLEVQAASNSSRKSSGPSDSALLKRAQEEQSVTAWQNYLRKCSSCASYDQGVKTINQLLAQQDTQLLPTNLESAKKSAIANYLSSCTSCTAAANVIATVGPIKVPAKLSSRAQTSGAADAVDESTLLETAEKRGRLKDWLAYQRGCDTCADYAKSVSAINGLLANKDQPLAKRATEKADLLSFKKYMDSCTGCQDMAPMVEGFVKSGGALSNQRALPKGTESELLAIAQKNPSAINWRNYQLVCTSCDEYQTATRFINSAQTSQDTNMFSQAQSPEDMLSYLASCSSCNAAGLAVNKIAESGVDLKVGGTASGGNQDAQLLAEAKDNNTIEDWQAYQRGCDTCANYDASIKAIAQLTAQKEQALLASSPEEYANQCSVCTSLTAATAAISSGTDIDLGATAVAMLDTSSTVQDSAETDPSTDEEPASEPNGEATETSSNTDMDEGADTETADSDAVDSAGDTDADTETSSNDADAETDTAATDNDADEATATDSASNETSESGDENSDSASNNDDSADAESTDVAATPENTDNGTDSTESEALQEELASVKSELNAVLAERTTLSNSLTSLKGRIENTETQLRQARQQLANTDDSNELTGLQEQLAAVKGELTTAVADRTKLSDDLTSLKQRMSETDAQLSQARLDADELKKRLAEATAVKATAATTPEQPQPVASSVDISADIDDESLGTAGGAAELEVLQEELVSVKSELTAALADRVKLSNSIEPLKQRIADTEAQLGKARLDLNATKKRLAHTADASSESNNQARLLAEKLAAAGEANVEQQATIDKLRAKLEEITAASTRATDSANANTAALQEAQQALQTSKANVLQLTSARDVQAAEIERLNNQFKAKSGELKRITRAFDATTAELQQATRVLNEKSTQLSALKSQLSTRQQSSQTLDATLAASKREATALRAQLAELKAAQSSQASTFERLEKSAAARYAASQARNTELLAELTAAREALRVAQTTSAQRGETVVSASTSSASEPADIPVVTASVTPTTSTSTFPPARTLASRNTRLATQLDINQLRFDAATVLPIATLTGHNKVIWDTAMSTNGRYVLSASDDNTLRRWDLRRGKYTVLRGHTASVNTVAVSPRNRTLASGSSDGTVRIWAALTGTNIGKLTVGAQVNSVAYSPNGRLIAVGLDNGDVQVWNAMTRRRIATLKDHQVGVTHVSFSPDNDELLSAALDKRIVRWSAGSWAKKSVLITSAVSHTINYSADGSRLITGSDQGVVQVWNAVTGEALASHTLHADTVNDAYFADRNTLVSAGEDNRVVIANIKTGRVINILEGTRATLLPGKGVVVTSANGRNIALYGAR